MFRSFWLFVLILMSFTGTLVAQPDCPLEPRLEPFGAGQVILDSPLNVRAAPGIEYDLAGQLNNGDDFRINGSGQCGGGIYWYFITSVSLDPVIEGYIAEGADGAYFVEPIEVALTATPVFELPALNTPAPPVTDTPLPPVAYISAAAPPSTDFVTWDWSDDITFYVDDDPLPDPFTIVPPDAYGGDMPPLPVDLSGVAFVTDTGLDAEGLALLAQNGFVVSPQGLEQIDNVYYGGEGWSPYSGYSVFVTTDGLLHSFYLVFENLLTFMEQESLYPKVSGMVAGAYTAAEAQAAEAAGTPLEAAARNAAIYYAVPLLLLNPAADETVALSPFGEDPIPVSALPGVDVLVAAVDGADPSILQEAQALVDLIVAADSQSEIPFLVDTDEAFDIYRPRGHYTISPLYERYFRAVTWLGRITFRAAQSSETTTALLVLRALQNDPAAVDSRQAVSETLEFLIGPVDNLGPEDYAPLAEDVFGDLSLEAIADANLLAQYQAALEALPPPAINTAVLPEGTMAEQLDEIGRGFRLLGQRFTIDANILQQVIDPEILLRTLPTALDVPAALGSDTAYSLSQQAGASMFPTYDEQMTMLREQVSDLTADDWLSNIYSSWLWALQPFWTRSAEAYPPLMNTDAWMRRDLQTGLSSYTELKHATILYTAQPMGGRGGGGELPLTYGYVEPNPLVFARIAIVSEALYQGLRERGLVNEPEDFSQTTYLTQTHRTLRSVTTLSTYLADAARRELTGEGLTEDDHYFIQYGYGSLLFGIRDDVQVLQEGPPKPVALVTDIASNGATREVLQVAVGGADYIYVVIPTPNGLQVARGGVYSYYEFVNQDGARMTDEEWRALVETGNVPPRPEWVSAFVSE